MHGATALADAVRVTLGPKSKCVLIEKRFGKPLVCNDGVTIAKEFLTHRTGYIRQQPLFSHRVSKLLGSRQFEFLAIRGHELTELRVH
ncbi:MAG: hypothetical protein LAO55_23025 [Acidobacteriia bacterium]|nr:hypothetical protein [Terriglobia bacterium]